VSRGWAVVFLAVLLVGAYLAMWRGWRRRAASQSDLPQLPAHLPAADVLIGPVEAVYLGTTSAGDWLDRVVARTLGRRSTASVTITTAGVVVERTPEPRLDIPVSALRGVRTDRAGAHRAGRTEQLLVLTWTHGDRLLETVLRPRRRRDLEALTAAAGPLLPDEATT
jgi:voltage-gated potassium channel Kch